MLAARTTGLNRSTIARASSEYCVYASCRPGRNTALGASLLASRIDIPDRTPNTRAS